MKPIQIKNQQARDLWLTLQGLGCAPTGPLDVLQMIKQLGFVQLDTIQVVARAHHHILWSRNTKYREPMLEALLSQDRTIFEHFTHDASVIPMEYLPMWERQFRRQKARYDKPGWSKDLPDLAERRKIKERIRLEGALSTKGFDSKRTEPQKMWSRPAHKVALDYMWYSGELATSHRMNFTKYYDLAERIFPTNWQSASLSDEAQIEWLCCTALERMGFGSVGDVQRYWDAVSGAEARAWQASASSNLCTVEIETAQGDWVTGIAPDDIEDQLAALKPVAKRLRILNPFDPVIRDRNRLQRLFGFEYRVEMFVPQAKRKWGYYVFPILEGRQFIGRIEVKADRKASTLTVLNFWQEEGVQWSKAQHSRLKAELERMRQFVGVDTLILPDD